MPTYEACLLCDDGDEVRITTAVDENEPLFMQDIILDSLRSLIKMESHLVCLASQSLPIVSWGDRLSSRK